MTDPRIDSRIGVYRLDRVLGRGGMGVVYLAHDTKLQRMVAVKLLAPEVSSEEHFREQLLREALSAARLEHPNIVPVYDGGEFEGQLFLAMRLIRGSDLGRLLAARGWLHAREVLYVGRQIGRALDAAHAEGLVHRDVKPANILVAPDSGDESPGHCYLTDFGVAKMAGVPGATGSGRLVGTVDYMSPDHLQGRIDHRADVYSLACVLFELLTGRNPFRRSTDWETMHAHMYDLPPSLDLSSDTEALDAVFGRALAKSPSDRHDSCGALVADLSRAFAAMPEDALASAPTPAPVFEPAPTRAAVPNPGKPAPSAPSAPSARPAPEPSPAANAGDEAHPSLDHRKRRKILRVTVFAALLFAALGFMLSADDTEPQGPMPSQSSQSPQPDLTYVYAYGGKDNRFVVPEQFLWRLPSAFANGEKRDGGDVPPCNSLLRGGSRFGIPYKYFSACNRDGLFLKVFLVPRGFEGIRLVDQTLGERRHWDAPEARWTLRSFGSRLAVVDAPSPVCEPGRCSCRTTSEDTLCSGTFDIAARVPAPEQWVDETEPVFFFGLDPCPGANAGEPCAATGLEVSLNLLRRILESFEVRDLTPIPA